MEKLDNLRVWIGERDKGLWPIMANDNMGIPVQIFWVGYLPIAKRVVDSINACANVTEKMFAEGWKATGHANYCKAITQQNAELLVALERMTKMHDLMMKKVNHGASFYDNECLREMNEAPIQAAKAIADAKGGAA